MSHILKELFAKHGEGCKALNLGSGFFHMDEWINVDCDPNMKPDVIADLEQKFPFDDGYADVIYCRQVLEHIRDLTKFMKECNRVLKVGGDMVVSVPMFGCTASIIDPDHVRFFVPETLLMFCNPKFFSPSNFSGKGLFDLLNCKVYKYIIGDETKETAGTFFTEIVAQLTKRPDGYWQTEEGVKAPPPDITTLICQKS